MTHDNTIERLSLALDAALMRQTAIAANIANANTAGYQAMKVSFEEQLTHLSNTPIKPRYEEDNAPVSIDNQMAMNVKNATHYRALIKGLNHKLAIMALAVHGNNQS